MRRALVLALMAGIACGGPQRSGGAKHSKLVVLVVIDQFPMWVFDRDKALFTGGIGRMLREGAFAVGEIPYANSFTAPGHASIGTGAPPNVHGVLGNTWYRRADGKEHDAEWDVASPVLAVGPPNAGILGTDDNGSSKMLRVDGIADSLAKATAGRGHSIAIGLKARAAVFIAGKRPDLAVWYEPAAGGMTTSKAYASEPPSWLLGLASSQPANRFFRSSWTPLDPALLAKQTRIPDAAPGEGNDYKLGAAFPHDLGLTDAPAKAIVHTPFADEIVMDTVYAALDGMDLGKDDVPDLLAVSFNAHDYAGHMWGADSWEVLDLTLRLDQALGKLFQTLDDRLGAGNWSAVLTSDHGATPVVERGKPGARRITSAEITDAVERVLGKGGVAKVSSSNIYLSRVPLEIDRATMTTTEAAAASVAKLPGIAAAGATTKLAHNCDHKTGLDQAICYSIVDGESGEIYVVPVRGSVITDYRTGTHHDAPFDDNRRVPILVLAPGRVTEQTGTASTLQIAPTVSALLGVPPPPDARLPALFGL